MPDSLPTHSLGPAGRALIMGFETCARALGGGRFAAYPDPGTGGAPWTIGWGSTGPDIRPGLIWTQAQCDARFAAEIQRYAAEVARAIGPAPTTQNQFDAMVSFHYNTGAIARAELTQCHIRGDYAGAKAGFAHWVRDGTRVMPGLVRRRAAEAELYGKG